MEHALANVHQHQHNWKTATPFSHLVIPAALDTERVIEMLEALSTLAFTKKEADLFTFLQTDDLNTCDDPIITTIRQELTSKNTIQALETITGKKLNGTIDLHATIYEDTHYLLCHDDDIQNRALAFMIYLCDIEENDGGALALYNTADKTPGHTTHNTTPHAPHETVSAVPTSIAKRIIPKSGQFVCFGVGDGSYHSVDEMLTDKQRIALAGWYHARQ